MVESADEYDKNQAAGASCFQRFRSLAALFTAMILCLTASAAAC